MASACLEECLVREWVGGLPCCAPARQRETEQGPKSLDKNQIHEEHFFPAKAYLQRVCSGRKKQEGCPIIRCIRSENVKEQKGSHVKLQGRRECHKKSKRPDGGDEQKHTLKKRRRGVITLDSLGHASAATDVLSPCPAWNVPEPSLCPQRRDCTVLCVSVCAQETTCLINH